VSCKCVPLLLLCWGCSCCAWGLGQVLLQALMVLLARPAAFSLTYALLC
jgi:hypothetical protein